MDAKEYIKWKMMMVATAAFGIGVDKANI